jgi:hypothetical protein
MPYQQCGLTGRAWIEFSVIAGECQPSNIVIPLLPIHLRFVAFYSSRLTYRYGRPVGTRTPDLYRVNAGISSTHNNLQGPLGTAKYLIIPSSRTHLGLAIGLKNKLPVTRNRADRTTRQDHLT